MFQDPKSFSSSVPIGRDQLIHREQIIGGRGNFHDPSLVKAKISLSLEDLEFAIIGRNRQIRIPVPIEVSRHHVRRSFERRHMFWTKA